MLEFPLHQHPLVQTYLWQRTPTVGHDTYATVLCYPQVENTHLGNFLCKARATI